MVQEKNWNNFIIFNKYCKNYTKKYSYEKNKKYWQDE